MPAASRRRYDKSERAGWTCADCLTLEEGRTDYAKHRRVGQLDEATLDCSICGALPRIQFSESDRHNAANPKHLTLCRTCRSPRCTNPSCPTCSVCRAPQCSAPGSCGKELVPVNPQQQPRTLADKFRLRCQYCQYPPCKTCGKPMPTGSRPQFKKSGNVVWTCPSC